MPTGPTFATVLWHLGTPEQKRFAELAVEREWGATMVLTEPDAGSDVGAGRTKAIEQPDGTWHIEGVKRFITGGEHDMAENIFHLVLARPEGAGPGTKGLSMFLVPKYHVNEDGSLGDRNGVKVTNIEHKMGLKVSTTCELTFGGDPDRPAVGTLVGGVHDGIRQMFMIIENARMLVGTKAIETLSTGYLNALDYAKNRVQGPDLAKQTDKASPRVTIIHHPDVRRMLMLQKAYTEGMRALVLYTADAAGRRAGRRPQRRAGPGGRGAQRPAASRDQGPGRRAGLRDAHVVAADPRRLGLPAGLPDRAVHQGLEDRLPLRGNHGHPVTGLLLPQDGPRPGGRRSRRCSPRSPPSRRPTTATSDGRLKTERAAIAEGVTQVEAMLNAMTGFLIGSFEQPEEIYKIGQQSVRLLLAFGDLIVAWLLARQAEVAGRALDNADALTESDRDFYTGKLAAARFFTTTVLPRLESDRRIIEETTNDLMDVPEGAF